jgi:hypothetical protein
MSSAFEQVQPWTTPVTARDFNSFLSAETARLVDEAGALVATGETTIDDDDVFALIDSGRR